MRCPRCETKLKVVSVRYTCPNCGWREPVTRDNVMILIRKLENVNKKLSEALSETQESVDNLTKTIESVQRIIEKSTGLTFEQFLIAEGDTK